MIIYRYYESERTNHKTVKPIRKSIKVARYTIGIGIPKSLKFCCASEITTFKYSVLIPPINKYFLSEQQKICYGRNTPLTIAKKTVFKNFL